MDEKFVGGDILTIPQSVLNNAEELDRKINRIANDSEKMATHFNSAMTRMSDGTDGLLNKLKTIQGIIDNIGGIRIEGMNGMAQTMSATATEAEKVATGITKASVAVNQFGRSGKNIAELTAEIAAIEEKLTKDEGIKPFKSQQKEVDLKRELEEELKLQRKSTQEKEEIVRKEYDFKRKEFDNYIKEQKKIQEANNKAMNSGNRIHDERRELEVMYADMFDRIDKAEKARYMNWLKLKNQETADHQKAEKEKQEATSKAIEKQLKDLEELKKKQEELRRLNSKVISNTEQKKKERREIELMYAHMFDMIDKREEARRKKEEANNRAAMNEAKQRAAYESKMRKNDYNRYVTSTEGALRSANEHHANTYTKRAVAIKNLEAAMKNLRTTDKNYQKDLERLTTAHKRLSQEQKRVDNLLRETRVSQSKLMDTSAQLARKLALIFSVSQIQGYMMNIVRVTGEFEKQNVALASILQNKNEANILFGKITELAVKSPFQLKELITYTKSLSAYQVEYEKLYDTTKMLADVSAGLGVDMQRLILAFGQVKASNFLRGTEVRQFTEAGLNILGELAKYYSELEGTMVSVGEVQERVTKRMVAFGDVEEIFKRITSAGGIFYKMQEKQAETLAGQISNLSDSIDIMLNSIGQENYGVINSSVGIIKSLVENWRILANILNAVSIGFVLYTAKTYLAARANRSFATSTIMATIEQKGLVSVMAKTSLMMKSFGNFLKNNPLLLGVTIFATLKSTLEDHLDAVKKNREEYDTLITSVNDYGRDVTDLLGKIDSQNKKIREANGNISKTAKGTEEYTEAEKEANKQRNEQDYLLGLLKDKYPEIYNGIVKQKDGTVELTKEQERLNAELEKTTYLAYLAKNQEGFFSDGLITNIKEASAAQKEYADSSENLDLAYKKAVSNAKELIKTNENIPKGLKKALSELVKSTGDYKKDSSRMVEAILGSTSSFRPILVNMLDGLDDAFFRYTKSTKDILKNNEDLENNIEEISRKFKNYYDTSTDEGKKAASSSLSTFLKSLDIQEKAVRDFVTKRFEVEVGVKINIEDTPNTKFTNVQKRINEYLKKNKFGKVPDIKVGEKMDDYFKKLSETEDKLIKEKKRIEDATQELYEKGTNKQRLEELKKELEQVTQTLDDWGYDKRKEKSKEESQELKDLRSQISLIKKAGQEYQKLQKYYSDDEAKQRVKDSFKDAFKEVGLSIDMDFDTQGIIDGIERISNNAGEEGRKAITKATSDLKAEVDIEVRKDNLNRLKGEIEDLFGSYELSMELNKSGLDKNLISDMFNVEIFSLKDVEKKLQDMKPLFYAQGEEYVKVWEDAEKKVTKMQNDEIQERMKKYLGFLRKAYGERASIIIDSQKQVKEVQDLGFDSTKEEAIVRKIKEDRDKKLSEVSWREFKESELYIKMFEDLEYSSTESVNYVLKKLEELRESLKDQDPQALKEITNQMENLRDIQIERNPFKGMVKGIKEFIEYQKEAEKLNKKFVESSEAEDALKKELTQQELNVHAAEEKYLAIKKSKGEYSQEAVLAKLNLDRQKEMLDVILKQLVAQGKITKELAAQIRNGDKNSNETVKRFSEIAKLFSEMSNSVGEVSEGIQSIFGEFSQGGKDAVETIQGVLDGMSQIAEGGANAAQGYATGNYIQMATGIVQGIGGTFKTLGELFSIGDKKKERAIQRQLKLVEQLADSYEKLREATERAYSIDELQKGTQQMNRNLEARNQALREAIKKEEDKKKTDHDRIKEWQKEIEANNKQIAENNKQLLESVGGFGTDDRIKSAAEEFAQAWLDAYLEVGNGLDGLQGKMNDWLKNAVQKQLLVNLSKEFITPLLKQYDEMFKEGSLGGTKLMPEEAAAWKDLYEEKSEQFNEAAKAYLEALKAAGIDLGKKPEGDSLVGLQKGIQGLNEATGEALEALLESVRYFTSDSNMQLKTIANTLINPPAENPFISEMRLQTEQLRMMYSLWGSLTMTKAGVSGKCLKINIV